MFGLFRKKSLQKVRQDVSELPLEQSAATTFDEEDFNAVLKGHFRPGNFAPFYFAKCLGLRGSTITAENFSDVASAVLENTPDNIDSNEKQLGFRHFEKEVVDALNSDYMEMAWDICPTEGKDLRITRSDLERLREIQKHCKRHKIRNLKDIFPKIDLSEEVFKYVASLRQYEVELLLSEINKREDAIKRLFRPLRNNRTNKYGDDNFDCEFNELEQFIDYAFEESDFRFFWSVKPLGVMLDYIDTILDGGEASNTIPTDGIDFEHWCADQVRRQGWQVVVSQASGDQGVDVIARRNGTKVAIQCKRYSNPIGNKSVQEAFTGAQNENAGYSCVIGTGGFTQAAKQIASNTGVKLIDAADIQSFSNLFGFESLELDAQPSDINDGNDQSVLFQVSGEGAGYIGSILRSFIKTSGGEIDHLDLSVCDSLLGALDETTGQGAFAVPRNQLALLLVLGASGLKTNVDLNERNVESMLESPFYDNNKVMENVGRPVIIEGLVHESIIRDAHEFLLNSLDQLGPLYEPDFREQISDILSR